MWLNATSKTRVLQAAAATKRQAAAGANNQNDPVDTRPPNYLCTTKDRQTCVPGWDGATDYIAGISRAALNGND